MRRTNRVIRRASGFTLLEMMLVVVIIGVLATVVIFSIGGSSDEAKRGATVVKLSQLEAALGTFYARTSTYPAALDALVTSTPPLINAVPTDGWGRPLVYYTPAQEVGKPFTLYSLGADNQAGTADDVSVWNIRDARAPGGG